MVPRMLSFLFMALILLTQKFGQAFVPTNRGPASWPCNQLLRPRSIATPARAMVRLSMVYIPDGMSKEQYEAIKAKEKADYDKVKGNLGKVGITKFQSRSFEAFQKSGQKNLFPVDPKAPINERPYMQRPGGKPDGSDLVQKGIKISQLKAGAKPQARTAVDAKYDQLEKEGLLKSSPFSLPWSNAQAQEVGKKKVDPVKGAKKTNAPAAKESAAAVPVQKKLFGLF